jgi:hypothetical protein
MAMCVFTKNVRGNSCTVLHTATTTRELEDYGFLECVAVLFTKTIIFILNSARIRNLKPLLFYWRVFLMKTDCCMYERSRITIT